MVIYIDGLPGARNYPNCAERSGPDVSEWSVVVK
jgi:hypothetical protein